MLNGREPVFGGEKEETADPQTTHTIVKQIVSEVVRLFRRLPIEKLIAFGYVGNYGYKPL